MNKELKSLIDQYCTGVKPTEDQELEIFDKAAETSADFKEVSSYMTKMQNGPTREERLAAEEAERKAREEAERKAKEEAERVAKEKAEKAAKAKATRETKKESKTKKETKVSSARKAKKTTVANPKPVAKTGSKEKVVGHKDSDIDLLFVESGKRAMLSCPYCAFPLPANSKICPECGNEIMQNSSSVEAVAPIAKNAKEAKKSRMFIYVIGSILALLLFFLLLNCLV